VARPGGDGDGTALSSGRHLLSGSLKSTGRDIPDNLFDGSNFLRFLKIYCFRQHDESQGIIIVSPAAQLIPLINLFSL
ncbi:Os12g0528801, partial [Oryza sativa Japonica Group]